MTWRFAFSFGALGVNGRQATDRLPPGAVTFKQRIRRVPNCRLDQRSRFAFFIGRQSRLVASVPGNTSLKKFAAAGSFKMTPRKRVPGACAEASLRILQHSGSARLRPSGYGAAAFDWLAEPKLTLRRSRA
jgi:hypothetical protein